MTSDALRGCVPTHSIRAPGADFDVHTDRLARRRSDLKARPSPYVAKRHRTGGKNARQPEQPYQASRTPARMGRGGPRRRRGLHDLPMEGRAFSRMSAQRRAVADVPLL
jgi:hypothetical protein